MTMMSHAHSPHNRSGSVRAHPADREALLTTGRATSQCFKGPVIHPTGYLTAEVRNLKYHVGNTMLASLVILATSQK